MAGRAWTSEFGGCLFVLQTCYNRGCVQQENAALSLAPMRAHCFGPKTILMTGDHVTVLPLGFIVHASTAFRTSIPYTWGISFGFVAQCSASSKRYVCKGSAPNSSFETSCELALGR
jgi:hypothetical protein